MAIDAGPMHIGLTWQGNAVSKNERLELGRGRLISGRRYRSFVEELMLTWMVQRPVVPLEAFCLYLIVRVGPRMDPQNLIDPAFDAIQAAGIVRDDRLVTYMELRVLPAHKQGEPDVIDAVVAEPLDVL